MDNLKDNKESISVILTGFKRPYTLKEQLEAVRNQTVEPDEIIFCHNEGNIEFDVDLLKDLIVIKCNTNLGVWARFSYALNCKSKYVCIFDDDTIPGKKWFENCLNTMKTQRGLLGANGIRFRTKHAYFRHQKVGWGKPSPNIEEVDIVGHSWFFEKQWLSYFWRELPRDDQYMRVGEDIHFAYTLQKYGQIKCYVPPNPIDDEQMWGNHSLKGHIYGRDINALSNEAICLNAMDDTFKYYIDKGFRLYNLDKIFELVKDNKPLFIRKLWDFYTGKKWDKLYDYSKKYNELYNENIYDDHLAIFFLAYSELEIGKHDDSKNHYMYLLDNECVKDNLKTWAYANIEILTNVFKHKFKEDFDKLWGMVDRKKNFAFSRYGDGEYLLITGQKVGSHTQAFKVDNWYANEKLYKIGVDLKNCLKHNEENYFYGIPHKTEFPVMFNFYKRETLQNMCKNTFASIFINSNYQACKEKISNIKEDVVIIGSKRGENNEYGKMNVLEYFPIEDNCVFFYEKNHEMFKNNLTELGKKFTNTLFLISAGPLSPIVVETLFIANPNNRYMDLGSAMDELIHKKLTREFINPMSKAAKNTSKW